MIRLSKAAEPAILVAHGVEWTEEFETLIAEGRSTSSYRRYKRAEVKTALIAETHGKCAYCESHVTHVYPGDVEHVYPKSRRPDLVVSWDNLIFACAECNNAKRDYYEEQAPLINPFVDEPRDHLVFVGAIIWHRPGSTLGWRSWQRLDLQRDELVERRGRRLIAVGALIDAWYVLDEGPDKELAKRAILEEASDDKEFSAAVRAFVEEIVGFELN